jgi:hypothetical protein
MTVFIGTDEAGYGPNLGPLVISATAWHVPVAHSDIDLYDRLAEVVSRSPEDHRVAIADSKVLYSSGSGLRGLETAIFATLSAMESVQKREEAGKPTSSPAGPSSIGFAIQTWRQLWSTLVPQLDSAIYSLPWHCAYDEPVPVDAEPRRLTEIAQQFHDGLSAAKVGLQHVEADAIFPCEFNRLVNQYGSKGAVLSQRTLQLVERVMRTSDDPLTVVQCDKHGGRNCYVSVLQPLFPEYLVEVVRESRATSVYRWGPPARRVEFRFSVNGESFLPTALASMYAKYLRELAMRAFNAFWQAHHEGLKPTAGYYVDAKRFYADIAAKQRELAIEEHLVWRCR